MPRRRQGGPCPAAVPPGMPYASLAWVLAALDSQVFLIKGPRFCPHCAEGKQRTAARGMPTFQ